MRGTFGSWGLCIGRPFEQEVGAGERADAGDEEEAAVERGEPEPGGAAGQAQPGGWCERAWERRIMGLRSGIRSRGRFRSAAARRAWLATG